MTIRLDIIELWFERRFGKDKIKTDGYFEEWVRKFRCGHKRSKHDFGNENSSIGRFCLGGDNCECEHYEEEIKA